MWGTVSSGDTGVLAGWLLVPPSFLYSRLHSERILWQGQKGDMWNQIENKRLVTDNKGAAVGGASVGGASVGGAAAGGATVSGATVGGAVHWEQKEKHS